MTIQEIFQVLDESGLRMSEASDLFKIAHSTLFDWKNGSTQPKNRIIFDHAIEVTRRIEKATKMGLFPLTGVPSKERRGAIHAALMGVQC